MSSISGLNSYEALQYIRSLTTLSTESTQTASDTSETFSTDETSSDSRTKTESTSSFTSLSTLGDSTLSALIQGLGVTETSATGETTSTSDMVTAMDTDGDGSITQSEFVSARPDDVSEEMATSLWDSINTEGAESLTTNEVSTAMASDGPHGPPPPPPSDEDDDDDDTLLSSTEDSTSSDSIEEILSQIIEETADASATTSTDFENMIASMDTDSDGSITQSEFVSARPDDVSEEMATTLWNSLDTEGVGSLSTSDLQTAMASNGPSGAANAPPPPPPANGMTDTTETTEIADSYASYLEQLNSDSATGITEGQNMQAFLDAIQSYQNTSFYDQYANQNLSSIMSMV